MGAPGTPGARGRTGEEPAVKVVKSLKSLKAKDGSIVVRRHGQVFVVNKRNPRWKARQG